jgi:predicted DNA binding CopG/RHH family protein
MLAGEDKKDRQRINGPLMEIRAIKTAADATFKKDRRITIRLYDHDYIGIQKKAMEMGVPYQTLISGLIHRYVEGDIKVKSAM